MKTHLDTALAPNEPLCILNCLKLVLVYYTAIMQFSIFFNQKLLCNTFKKLIHSIMQSLFKIQIFWPTTTFFTKIFLAPTPNHFGRSGTCHDITKSAGSEKNNKPSDNDSMTDYRILQKCLSRLISQTTSDWRSKETRKY